MAKVLYLPYFGGKTKVMLQITKEDIKRELTSPGFCGFTYDNIFFEIRVNIKISFDKKNGCERYIIERIKLNYDTKNKKTTEESTVISCTTKSIDKCSETAVEWLNNNLIF